MRSSIAVAAGALMLACADAPTAPLLQPEGARFELGKAPPPWAEIEGEITTDGSGGILTRISLSRGGDAGARLSHAGPNTAIYRGWLLVTPGEHAAMLRFADGGTNVTFSGGARISKVNGKVTGAGTMTVGGHTYALSAVTVFEANGECATAPWDYTGPSCASFSAGNGSFRSEASVWTGVLSSGGGREFDLPPGWDVCKRGGCVCAECEITITDPTGRGR